MVETLLVASGRLKQGLVRPDELLGSYPDLTFFYIASRTRRDFNSQPLLKYLIFHSSDRPAMMVKMIVQ